MNLSLKQTELKSKLTNPIFEKKYETHFVYVFLFFIHTKLIRISHSHSLEIRAPPQSDEIKIFPFQTLDLAKAFESRVRYHYKIQL